MQPHLEHPRFRENSKLVTKVLSIIERKISMAEGETSEALAIVVLKIYLFGFVIQKPDPRGAWGDQVNLIISKVHHNLYKSPGMSKGIIYKWDMFYVCLIKRVDYVLL